MDELERGIENVMRSYENGLFSTDSQYLGAVAKLYVEYNHKIKIARFRNNTALIGRVTEVKNAVLKALDDQNSFVIGSEQSMGDAPLEPVFTEVDFNSEILFDAATPAEVEQGEDLRESQMVMNEESEVPMEFCDETVSEKRCQETKPRVEEVTGQPVRRRRRTLIQKMRGRKN